MSRVGKKPITVPKEATVTLTGNKIVVKGPKGELSWTFRPEMKVTSSEGVVTVERPNNEKLNRSLHGLTRMLISNMVEGVTKGFQKKLEIIGVGYRAQISGKKLTLALGYSHPIEVQAPEGITFEIDKEKKNVLYVMGIDKQLVGEVAAKIRGFRPPEPYKGKGVKYSDEIIKRKAGKAAAAAAGGGA